MKLKCFTGMLFNSGAISLAGAEWLPHIVSPGSDHMREISSFSHKEVNKSMSKNVKLFLSLEYLSSTLG